MISREEAKNRMKTNWCKFHSIEESVNALLSQDQVKIDEINACRARCNQYNAKMELDIDQANEEQFEEIVKSFKPYQDKGV